MAEAFKILSLKNTLDYSNSLKLIMRGSFEHREIVWGKIEAYPWWPGRIVSMHIQSQEIVYKILFFADPTYAYLREEQLRPYAHLDPHAHSRNHSHPQLKRAITIATQSYAKLNILKKTHSRTQDDQPAVELPNSIRKQSPDHIKQGEFITSSNLQHEQIPQQDEPQHEDDSAKDKFDRIRSEETMINVNTERQIEEEPKSKEIYEDVTVENIVEVLQSRIRGEQAFEYNYENRKNAIRQKIALKEKLLQKYNLHNLIPLPTTAQTNQNASAQTFKSCIPLPKKKNGIKRSKLRRQKNQKAISQLQDKCLKRLYQYARKSLNSKVESSRLKVIASNSIKKLVEISQNSCHNFKQMYMNLIRFVQRLSYSQVEQFDVIGHFNGYLDRLQNEKNEQEEGSKMTQVSVPYN